MGKTDLRVWGVAVASMATAMKVTIIHGFY